MESAFFNNDTHSFCGEVKKLKSKGSSVPNIVGDAHGSEAIGNLFSPKYGTLYNSVSYDINEMNNLKSDTNARIVANCCHDGNIVNDNCEHGHLHNISRVDVRNAVLHLNTFKQDGNLTQ